MTGSTAVLRHDVLAQHAINIFVCLKVSICNANVEARTDTSTRHLVEKDEDKIETGEQRAVHLEVLGHGLSLVVVPADRVG